MRPFGTLHALPLSLLLSTLVAAQAKLGIEITKPVECNRKAENGDKISANYIGTLQSDGTQFDSSYDRGQPFEFTLGAGDVIKGWDQGLLGMCIGEKRKLVIPPSLAYGSEANGKIPGDSTLSTCFVLNCVDVLGLHYCSIRDRTHGHRRCKKGGTTAPSTITTYYRPPRRDHRTHI